MDTEKVGPVGSGFAVLEQQPSATPSEIVCRIVEHLAETARRDGDRFLGKKLLLHPTISYYSVAKAVAHLMYPRQPIRLDEQENSLVPIQCLAESDGISIVVPLVISNAKDTSIRCALRLSKPWLMLGGSLPQNQTQGSLVAWLRALAGAFRAEMDDRFNGNEGIERSMFAISSAAAVFSQVRGTLTHDADDHLDRQSATVTFLLQHKTSTGSVDVPTEIELDVPVFSAPLPPASGDPIDRPGGIHRLRLNIRAQGGPGAAPVFSLSLDEQCAVIAGRAGLEAAEAIAVELRDRAKPFAPHVMFEACTGIGIEAGVGDDETSLSNLIEKASELPMSAE